MNYLSRHMAMCAVPRGDRCAVTPMRHRLQVSKRLERRGGEWRRRQRGRRLGRRRRGRRRDARRGRRALGCCLAARRGTAVAQRGHATHTRVRTLFVLSSLLFIFYPKTKWTSINLHSSD